MVVYRLEDTKEVSRFPNVGGGVYGKRGSAYKVTHESRNTNHPPPFNEPQLSDIFNDDYVCCFKTVTEVHRWFEGLMSVMKGDLCYLRIATYVVIDKDFHQGRYQAIAKASAMELVEIHDIYYQG